MTNPFRQALHTGAVGNAALAVFCANVLLFVLLAGLAVVSLLNLRRLSRGLVARMAVSLAMAVLLGLVAGPQPAPAVRGGPDHSHGQAPGHQDAPQPGPAGGVAFALIGFAVTSLQWPRCCACPQPGSRDGYLRATQ